MEAKDTIIGATCGFLWEEQACSSLGKQADASFKAGMKEVVEWITEHAFIRYDGKHTDLAFSKTNWQAKLKEWDIK